jgi:inner membrane protein
MDPLTQGALGAAAAVAFTGNRNPRLAAGVGWLAGMFPDLDIVIRSASDPLIGLIYHRHFTHALVFVPVAGLIACSPFLVLPKYREQRGFIYAAACIGALTHAPLDAATTYGTLLYWPFSSDRVSWDLIGIVDLVFTFALLAGLVASISTRRALGSQIGLGIAALYLAFGGFQQHRAEEALARLAEARGHAVTRLRAMPQLGELDTWRGVYESGGRIHADMIEVPYFGAPMVLQGGSVKLSTLDDLTPEQRANPDMVRAFRVIEWFSEGWVAQPPGTKDFFGDMRYVLDLGSMVPMWGITLDPEAPRSVRWGDPSTNRRMRRTLDSVFRVPEGMRPLDQVIGEIGVIRGS